MMLVPNWKPKVQVPHRRFLARAGVSGADGSTQVARWRTAETVNAIPKSNDNSGAQIELITKFG